MSYRDDLDALTARAAALDREVAERTRERDDLRRLIAEARGDDGSEPWRGELRIASPCSAAWDAMDGDDRVRHCATCRTDVYNFSAMTRREVEALLVAREGNVCARFYQRRDGTVLLADCTVGRSRKRHQLVFAGAVAASLAAVAVGHAIDPPATSHVDVEDSVTLGALREEPDLSESIGGEPYVDFERHRSPVPATPEARAEAIAIALRAGQHAERAPRDPSSEPDVELAERDLGGEAFLHLPPHLPKPPE